MSDSYKLTATCPLGHTSEESVAHSSSNGVYGPGGRSLLTHVECGECGVHFTPRPSEPTKTPATGLSKTKDVFEALGFGTPTERTKEGVRQFAESQEMCPKHNCPYEGFTGGLISPGGVHRGHRRLCPQCEKEYGEQDRARGGKKKK